MARKLLSVFDKPVFDDDVIGYEYHNYYPLATNTYGLNDEIRIPIHSSDQFLDLSNSYIYIEGSYKDLDMSGKFVNNFVPFLFREARYELNGILVDQCVDCGMTTLMKNLLSLKPTDGHMCQHMGWNTIPNTGSESELMSPNINVETKTFSAVLPLNKMFGMMEDYKRVLVTSNHTLVLYRARNDDDLWWSPNENAVSVDVRLDKIEWCVAKVTLSDNAKLKFLPSINKNTLLYIPFRKWSLYENPEIRSITKDVWTIKSFTHLERPRYVIIAFQNDRRNNIKKNNSHFDTCNVTNVTLYINDMKYPYNRLDMDVKKGRVAKAFQMYVNFQHSYYNGQNAQPLLNYDQFSSKYTLFCVDCSKQEASLTSSTCDVKIEYEASENFPTKTKCYALILHDVLFSYRPLTGTVHSVNDYK